MEQMKVNKPNIKPPTAQTAIEDLKIMKRECFICKEPFTNDMVLIGKKERTVFSCIDHEGVVQEFVEQYGRPPLGWEILPPQAKGETNVGEIRSKKSKG